MRAIAGGVAPLNAEYLIKLRLDTTDLRSFGDVRVTRLHEGLVSRVALIGGYQRLLRLHAACVLCGLDKATNHRGRTLHNRGHVAHVGDASRAANERAVVMVMVFVMMMMMMAVVGATWSEYKNVVVVSSYFTAYRLVATFKIGLIN